MQWSADVIDFVAGWGKRERIGFWVYCRMVEEYMRDPTLWERRSLRDLYNWVIEEEEEKVLYRIVWPHDHGSEKAYAQMQEELGWPSADAIEEAWTEEVHRRWPGLRVARELDYGFEAWADTPPPQDLPVWVWVSEVDGMLC